MLLKIGTRDFLKRARERLDENTPESMIYAALELRLGIEARLHIYNDVIEDLPKKKSKGWRIVELDKNLENTFRKGNTIIEIIIIDMRTEKPIEFLYYTPVSKELVKKGGEIGEILHAKNIHQSQKETWFADTKAKLEEIYVELHNANKGTLLGPPLRKAGSNEFLFNIENYEGHDFVDVYNRIGGEGTLIKMEIYYPEKYPT